MKTHVFTILLRGWNIRIHKIFQSKFIKIRACNPSKLLCISNHRKYGKVNQNGRQRGTQNPSKIMKSQSWDPPGLLCVHLYSTWSPKWFPRTPKMIENCHLVTLILGSTPKLSGVVLFEDTSAGWGLAGQQSEGSSKLNRCKPCISSNPSLTSGCNHKGGRRQGRSLRIRPHPKGVQGVPRGL